MADIVLGIGTSHTPLLSIPAQLWPDYAAGDKNISELCYPPSGEVLSFEQGLQRLPDEIKQRFRGSEPFAEQAAACQRALDELANTLQSARPDITIIISDDQDEWLYEDNMPMFSVYWGETVPMLPRRPMGRVNPEVAMAIVRGYGEEPLDVPVAGRFGRYLIEYLVEHDFDIAHMHHLKQPYGGTVARRYPTPDGELQSARQTEPHEQGLPHGYAFIIKRLYNNQPRPILPIIQNTCYPPNQPTPRRSFAFGEAIAQAIKSWDNPAQVAVVASGGLSHFVVDEELDRTLLGGLQSKDAETLRSLPRHRLHSATSESLNWVALGGVMQHTDLRMQLVDYVPVYRTPAGTGGGWAFARWE